MAVNEIIPSWAGKAALGAVGALVLLGLSSMRTDVSEIASAAARAHERLGDHDTRITVLEKRDYATKADIVELKSWLKDCIQAAARDRECRE